MTTKAAFITAMGGSLIPMGQRKEFTAASTDICTATAHGLTTGAGPFKVMTDNADAPSGLTAAVASEGTLTFVSAVTSDVMEVNGTTYTFLTTPATADDLDVAASDVLQAEVAASVFNRFEAPAATTYFAGSTLDRAVEVVAAAGVLTVRAKTLDATVGDAITLESVDSTITSSPGATLGSGATGTDYYVSVIDANTFYLSTTAANAHAGTAVDIADAGTGTHELVSTVQTLADTYEALLNHMVGVNQDAFAIERFWNTMIAINGATYSD